MADGRVAIVALLVWAAVKIYENHEIQEFEHAAERGFH